jgi:DNA-binding winged helix-turn-helix (wHTH) protein
VPRYHFGNFIVSPRRRLLVRDGLELPLIPRYFDLLVFLIERRHEALHRRDIFDRVWNDVIVSDSALSQAIRTIRRTLGDDSREPRFIRTVSRRGYRFVFADVVEEEDDAAWVSPNASSGTLPDTRATAPDAFEPLLERVTRLAHGANEEEEHREAAAAVNGIVGLRPARPHDLGGGATGQSPPTGESRQREPGSVNDAFATQSVSRFRRS